MPDYEEVKPGQKLARARATQMPKPSQYDLAEMYLGSRKKRDTIAAWELGRNNPDTAVIKKIAEDWSIPLQWFYDGQDSEPPILAREPRAVYGAPLSDPPGPSSTRGAQIGVGRRNFPVVGRAGAAVFPVTSEPNDPDAIMDFSDALFDRFHDQFVIKVWGESAEPELRHGDWVLVTKDPGFRIPGYFVVIKSPDHEYLVKVLKGSGDDIEFHSVNTAFAPFKLVDDWEMVGYLVGWKRESGKNSGKYIEAGDTDGLKPGFKG